MVNCNILPSLDINHLMIQRFIEIKSNKYKSANDFFFRIK